MRKPFHLFQNQVITAILFFAAKTYSFVPLPHTKRTIQHWHVKMNGPDMEFWDTIAKYQPSCVLYPTAFAACFRIGAAMAVVNQPRLPDIKGYPVGSKIVSVPRTCETDESRVEISNTTGRLRLFYPCEIMEESIRYAPYCTDGRATSDGMAALVGFRQIGISFLLAHLANATSGCYENDPPLTQQSFPLLIYSHGYGGNMDMATYFLRSIATQGVIVAAMEHTDGTASSTVVRDDANDNATRRLDFDPSLYSLECGLRIRASEILKALDYIPSLFSNVRDIFLGGHSYGAPSALLASQSSKNISGLVLHDPALSMGYGLLTLPPSLPTVSYTSDEYHRAGIRCGDHTYHVRGAFHGNFVDAPLWAPLWVMRTLSLIIPACGPADPNQVHEDLATSVKAFTMHPVGTVEDQLAEEQCTLLERV